MVRHSKENSMATPTEHRANIIAQDLTRAEELTRRQYKVAVELAAASGAEDPATVAGLLAAMALNFATIHGKD